MRIDVTRQTKEYLNRLRIHQLIDRRLSASYRNVSQLEWKSTRKNERDEIQVSTAGMRYEV